MKSRFFRFSLFILLAGSSALARTDAPQAPRKTENVVLILIDGLRWQEVFTGAEEALMNKENGKVEDENQISALRKKYWRDTPEARRETLMPFLWTVIAKEGQIYGNQNKNCVVQVSNGKKFSYPGYSEMTVGFADARIDSNAKKPNPNVTVFEWLHQKPAFKGRVAAFGVWDVVPYILNRERCGFYVNGAFEPVTAGTPSPEQQLLNKLKADIPSPWESMPYDALVFYPALEYVKEHKPRALWLTFGETDEWAHEGEYDQYLDAAHRTDQFIQQLWETLQTMPEYKGKTTLIVAVDHGRGSGPKEWCNHNAKTDGAENIWIAVLGPDTPALGERADTPAFIQAQIAATVAAAVGEDYCAAVPQAAPPIWEAVGLPPQPRDKNKDARIAWWREARFGLFVHWGLYSGAGGQWDGKEYKQHYAEWIQNWAAVPCADYAKILKPKFTAAKFDADAWAKLAKEAGMKYAVLTSKHHEGFTLFNSKEPYSLSNPITGGTNISPPGRDLAREFADGFRKNGLRVGFYYSLLDWQHPDAYEISLPGYPKDNKPRDRTKYLDYMAGHVKELLANCGPLDVFWFDYSTREVQGEAWRATELLKIIRAAQPNILVNNRLWEGLENRNGDFGTPEKYVPATGLPGMDWEVNHTMNESYGFSLHDKNWKTVPQTIQLLVDIVSKGGNLLLNVGPTAEGEIPPEAVNLLKGVGAWMKINSESIYGTTASPFPKLAWGRCTQKPLKEGGTRLYLHVFDWPKDGKLLVPGLKNKVTSAALLADASKPLKTSRAGGDVVIEVPAAAPDAAASVLVLNIEGAPEVERGK